MYRCHCSHPPFRYCKPYIRHRNTCSICRSYAPNAAPSSNPSHDNSLPAAATREDDDADSTPSDFSNPGNCDNDDYSLPDMLGDANSLSDSTAEDENNCIAAYDSAPSGDYGAHKVGRLG